MSLAEALNEEIPALRQQKASANSLKRSGSCRKMGQLPVELQGQLAALLSLANKHPRSKETGVDIRIGCGGSQPL
jgi:hypothetical protein